MCKNKWIWFLVVCLAISGCQTANIPAPYNFKVKELRNNVFGCWMEVSYNSSKTAADIRTISGELLTTNGDSLLLLVADGVVSGINNLSIVSAKLYTHKNQSNTYLLTTGILILPSIIGALANPDYAGEFLLMGLPAFITGITQTAIESSKKRNILVYPEKNKLSDFGKFARFPGGIPPYLDFKLLFLKKM